MQGGCDIIGFLCNCINRGALLQEDWDIIDPLSNVSIGGARMQEGCYIIGLFDVMVSKGGALLQEGWDSIVFFM